MGKGTIELTSTPKKRKLYGDADFYLRPIFQSQDLRGDYIYFFALRPVIESNSKLMLEGEFGVGEGSFKLEKKDVRAGDYKYTRYVYYKEDIEYMSPEQYKKIMRWAKDGCL